MNKKLDSIKLKSLIGYSIDSEEKSKGFYKKFVDSGKGMIVSTRFKGLMKDEELHKKTLLKLHEKIYGDRNYERPKKDDLPPHEDFENLENIENLIDALEKAINNEYNAIRIYEYLAEREEEHSGVFEYLAAMEHGHYESLNNEKELYERKTEEAGKKSSPESIWKNLGLEGVRLH